MTTTKTLRPFQKEGVKFIEKVKGRGLIGDDMSLGKTGQVLTYLEEHPELHPALVVCPASLQLNWKEETQYWFSGDVRVIDSKNHVLGLNLNIVSYTMASKMFDELQQHPFQIMILDEVQSIKDTSTLRTKAINSLAKGIPQVVGLSGTPMINRPGELFPILHVIRPDLFDSWPRFMKKYGITFRGRWRKNDPQIALLRQDLQEIMIRRLKKDVLPELPDKTRIVVPFVLSNQDEYEKATQDIISWINENEGPEEAVRAKRAQVIVRIEKLKQIALRGKLEGMIEWIENFIGTGEKLVIFATHCEVVNYLKYHFEDKAVMLTGKNTVKQKQQAVNEFQTNTNIKLIICNLRAGGVGYNLTAASTTAFVEIGWTPGEHDQAEDRPNRIGQTANKVIAYYLLSDTIERDIADLIDNKRIVVSQLMDGQEVEEEALLVALLNKMLARLKCI
jgi:SWI/SNF-related matrix-associated actin-dependent regulator 1 of chromatin subfamily A